MDNQFELLRNDPDVLMYFNEKSLYNFVKKFMKIDELLSDHFKNGESKNQDGNNIENISK